MHLSLVKYYLHLCNFHEGRKNKISVRIKVPESLNLQVNYIYIIFILPQLTNLQKMIMGTSIARTCLFLLLSTLLFYNYWACLFYDNHLLWIIGRAKYGLSPQCSQDAKQDSTSHAMLVEVWRFQRMIHRKLISSDSSR